ncbi:hypothetical protein PPYR_10461 [Photinus pyralis]|uniref:Uncharacterized protein n=2 Tax=Photinus pyralis TaxID=7054 RepID=A0A5N4AGC1_PHOPY|nr:hypothetical protein PPYR_10461 [Photinus pyralis]
MKKDSNCELNSSESWTLVLSDSVALRQGDTPADPEVIRLHEKGNPVMDNVEEPAEQTESFPIKRRRVSSKRTAEQTMHLCVISALLIFLGLFVLGLQISKRNAVVGEELDHKVRGNFTRVFRNRTDSLDNKGTCPNLGYRPLTLSYAKNRNPSLHSEGFPNFKTFQKPPTEARSKKMVFAPDHHSKAIFVTKETLNDLVSSLHFTYGVIHLQECFIAVIIARFIYSNLKRIFQTEALKRRTRALKEFRKTVSSNISSHATTTSDGPFHVAQQCASNEKESYYLDSLKHQHEEQMASLRTKRERQRRSIEALISGHRSRVDDAPRDAPNNLKVDHIEMKINCYKRVVSYYSKREQYLEEKMKFIDDVSKSVKEIMRIVSNTSTKEFGKSVMTNLLDDAIQVFPEEDQLKTLRSTVSVTNLKDNLSSPDMTTTSDADDGQRAETSAAEVKTDDVYARVFGKKGNEIRKRDAAFWGLNVYPKKVCRQSRVTRSSRSRRPRRRVRE